MTGFWAENAGHHVPRFAGPGCRARMRGQIGLCGLDLGQDLFGMPGEALPGVGELGTAGAPVQQAAAFAFSEPQVVADHRRSDPAGAG